jgi:hypothetical protein
MSGPSPSPRWIIVGSPPPDLGDISNLLSRYKIESVAGSADAKFTSWSDSKGSNHLDQNNGGGLTFRVAASGFGGLNAAEAAASSDGLYMASFNAGLAQPYSIVAFGKFPAVGAATNGQLSIGNSSSNVSNLLGKTGGSYVAWGSAGNALFWNAPMTAIAVYTVVWNGTSNSQAFVNATQDGSNGNLGTGGYSSASFGIGQVDATQCLPGFQVNEVAVYSKAISSVEIGATVVPYFRTKSGLALP